MVAAFTTVLFQGGENTVAHAAASDFTEWLTENEQILSNNTMNFDRDLPTKTIFSFGSSFNHHFQAAKCAVPKELWLNFNHIKDKTLSNQFCIILPELLTESLNPKKWKDREKEKGNKKGNKKPKVEIHDGQLIQLKSSDDFCNSVTNGFLRTDEGKSACPKFDGKTQQCLKFVLKGTCNTNCPRKAAHKTVKTNNNRGKDLIKFRKEALDWCNHDKADNGQNFAQREPLKRLRLPQ